MTENEAGEIFSAAVWSSASILNPRSSIMFRLLAPAGLVSCGSRLRRWSRLNHGFFATTLPFSHR